MKKAIYILIIISLLGGTLFYEKQEARAGWYDGSWTYRKSVTVQSSKVETTETSFPVLVSVTDLDLRSTGNGGHVSQANGYDIIFTDDDGTSLLDFEIESWDNSTGEIQAWVETDISTTVDKTIYMYYGNSSATDISDAEGVWDINFVMVQHLQEDPTGGATPDGSDEIFDSTSNNNDGNTGGTMLTEDQVAGQIDGSLDFDGGDDHVDMGTTPGCLVTNSSWTASVWINPSLTVATWDRIFLQGDSSCASWQIMMLWHTNRVSVVSNADGAGGAADNSTSVISKDVWSNIIWTYDGSTHTLYTNGTDDTQTPIDMNAGIQGNVYIGRRSSGNFWDGLIDEVRISNVARTAGWIETEYNNQSSPETFLAFESEERDVYYLMQSDNFRIEKDSINFGGMDDGRSDTYRLKDTMGEIGTGFSESGTYQVDAGYRQMDEEEVLSFSIRNSGETADTNACALGTLSTGSVSTCSYRLKIGSTASAGFQVGLWADDQLNQSVASIDVDDITENFTVAAGTEGHGITVAPPTDNGTAGTAMAWTEQDPFDDDDTPIPAGEGNMDVIFASNGTQDVDLYGTGDLDGTTLITHRAAISTATREGSYDQVVTYVVSSVL